MTGDGSKRLQRLGSPLAAKAIYSIRDSAIVCPLAEHAGRHDVAAMRADEIPGDDETQPGAARQ